MNSIMAERQIRDAIMAICTNLFFSGHVTGFYQKVCLFILVTYLRFIRKENHSLIKKFKFHIL